MSFNVTKQMVNAEVTQFYQEYPRSDITIDTSHRFLSGYGNYFLLSYHFYFTYSTVRGFNIVNKL